LSNDKEEAFDANTVWKGQMVLGSLCEGHQFGVTLSPRPVILPYPNSSSSSSSSSSVRSNAYILAIASTSPSPSSALIYIWLVTEVLDNTSASLICTIPCMTDTILGTALQLVKDNSIVIYSDKRDTFHDIEPPWSLLAACVTRSSVDIYRIRLP
jgi:hypothetical protein